MHSLITILIVIVGLAILWHLKWNRSAAPLTYSTFFLGGETVGETLTTNNNWGLCFAFANAVWYYAFLGYYYGPWVFLLQLPWSIAIIMLSSKMDLYLRACNYGTVHGFIRHNYGQSAGIVAAIATVTGYTINIGFELFYSAYLLSVAIGIPKIGIFLGFFLAVFVAGYCAAGGYLGNVRTDRYQNFLGVIALMILIVLLKPAYTATNGSFNVFASINTFSSPPWHFIVGVSTFAFFFNFVDMANWQSLAANKKLNSHGNEIRKVKRGLIFSSMIQLLAPAMMGCWLGVMLKGLKADLADDQYFYHAFTIAFGQDILSSVFLGVVILGFIAITISSAGSYLLASVQTLAVDLFWQYEPHNGQSPEMEAKVLKWSRHKLLILSITSVATFSSLYYFFSHFGIQGLAFQFQFVMYGVVVTLIPSVLTALIALVKNTQPKISNTAAFYSIICGLIAVILPFIIAATIWDITLVKSFREQLGITIGSDAIINLTPVWGLITASAVCFLSAQRDVGEK